jgi:hypothetical protein
MIFRTYSQAKFKCEYMGTKIAGQNCIREEIKSRLNPRNSCYHLVQSLLASRLLCTKIKVKIYVVLYGCEAWSLKPREEHRLRVL